MKKQTMMVPLFLLVSVTKIETFPHNLGNESNEKFVI